jgi:hypothetical protein
MSALGIFAGRLGAYNLAKAGYPQPQQALELAEKLDSRGVSPQEIYKRTSEYLKDTPFAGVTKLKDGQFRFEIPDNEMKIIRTKRPFGDVLQLDQAIEHPLFFKAYPQMSRREIQFTRDWERPGTLGTYSPSGSIEVNIEPLDPAVLAHELNHAAQHFEGDLYPETVQPRDYSTYANYEKAFFHQPWEAEAEETRYRFPLTPAERRANPPFYSMPSEGERPFPYPRGAQSTDQILVPQMAPLEWQSWMGELPEGYGPPKPGPGIFERGIEHVRRVFRDELDRENHGMPRYAKGGTPPVGEPAIVGEQGNVQLTPVDHDPFDDTLAQRAAHTISALAQHAADWWHEQPSWLDKAEELRKRDDARFAAGSKLNVRDFVMDPLRYELASGFGAGGSMREAVASRMFSPRIAEIMAERSARTPMAAEPQSLYHATSDLLLGRPKAFNPNYFPHEGEFGPHIGTAEQAENRAAVFKDFPWWQRRRVVPLMAQFKSPVDTSDFGFFSPARMSDELYQKGVLSSDERQSILDSDPVSGEQQTKIRQLLLDKGYDSIRYENVVEGSGYSYIPLARGTVSHAKTGRLLYGAGGAAPLLSDDDRSSHSVTLTPVDHDPFN